MRARELEGEQSARVQAKQAQLVDVLRQLPDAERLRYRALETLTQEIRQNYRSLDVSSQALLDELVSKLDFLLAFYLRMRHSLVKMEAYFRTTDAERLDERIAMLEHEISSSSERIREIKGRTKSVLLKRKERFAKAQENRQVIEAQTETVLEVLQLLRDQSFAMRDPREISAQLDGLVTSAEETERGVRDMEELMSLDQDLSLAGSFSDDAGLDLAALEGLEEERPAPSVVRVRPAVLPPPPPPLPPPRKKIRQ